MVRLSDERGEIASTLMIFLMVITMFFAAVHALYVFHGSHVVSAAAQDALLLAQLDGGSEARAEARGNERLALFPALEGTVDVTFLGDDQVEAVATATISTPLFDINTNLTTRVQGPIERFYEENERE